MDTQREASLELQPTELLGKIEQVDAEAPIRGAVWYQGYQAGDGLLYQFPAGALVSANYLCADMLVDGNHLTVFRLMLQEGEDGAKFHLLYSALNQCSARMRMKLEAVKQNRWRYDREGAWLKPMCGGSRVDLSKVDRMSICLLRKSEEPVRWCLTAVNATVDAPPILDELVLPNGPLLDELGQSTIHEWEAKSKSVEEVTHRLETQLAEAPEQQWPSGFSRWGGWTHKQFEETGFFRTEHDGTRWWLVDPDGYAFWSAGMDCVRVDTNAAYQGLDQALAWMPDSDADYAAIYSGGATPTINYLAANFVRAFGPDAWYEKWSTIALAELRHTGFNTVANWSDWQIARDASFPYVRPLALRFGNTPMIFRDFPDVYHPGFQTDVTAYASQLSETAEDPAFIGYFLMNEPTWGFAAMSPAMGMLLNTPVCETRKALSDFLRAKYADDSSLSSAWGIDTGFDEISVGDWDKLLGETARHDLESFSTVMVEMLFGRLSEACREVDPNHLNLGARYYSVPPSWAVDGMRCFDVFSVNGYGPRVRAEELQRISEMFEQPVMVGEWHFGALDVGLPGSGIGRVRDQAQRGKAFRIYTEDAASKPWCVGVHYFTLYDESALGRFDGENWNIGFVDVCNRPYEALAKAARASHERLYHVALGEASPYDDEPEYLPLVFL